MRLTRVCVVLDSGGRRKDIWHQYRQSVGIPIPQCHEVGDNCQGKAAECTPCELWRKGKISRYWHVA